MKTGDIMARATNDMRSIRMATGMALVAFVDGLFLTLAIVIILFSTNPSLALLTIAPLPFITLVILGFGKLIGRRFKEVQEGFSRLSDHVQETLSGIRVLKSFVREPWADNRFVEKSDDYMDKNMKLVRLWGFFFPLIMFISGLTSILLMQFGGIAVMVGHFTPGDFIAFLTYLAMLRWPVMGMGFTINMLQRGAASLARINEILNQKPEITSPPDGIMEVPHTGIEVRDLTFDYGGGEKALSRVSLELEEGSILGILGRTGSGKSTLVRLLPRLLDPPRGSIFLGGIDVRDYDLAALRSCIALVPQDTFLFSASVRENICFARPDAPEEEILEALRSGFRTEVLLQIRVYRPSPILPGLLPDLLQDEHEVVHVATWDPFQLVYTLDSSFSGRITFSHPFLLMVGLTRLRGFPLPILRDVGPEEARHILVRARVSPVKLRPPLNILTLFNFSPYHQSSWTRLEYQIGGGEP